MRNIKARVRDTIVVLSIRVRVRVRVRVKATIVVVSVGIRFCIARVGSVSVGDGDWISVRLGPMLMVKATVNVSVES